MTATHIVYGTTKAFQESYSDDDSDAPYVIASIDAKGRVVDVRYYDNRKEWLENVAELRAVPSSGVKVVALHA